MPDPILCLFDDVATPIIVLDVDATRVPRFADFNRAAREITGFTLAGVRGKTARDLFPGRFGQDAFAAHCAAARSGDEACYEDMLPVPGGARLMRTTLRPTRNADGIVTRITGTMIDISAEQSARDSRSALRTSGSELEQFIAMAAHDLRSPMRNVSELAELLRDGFHDHGDGKLHLIDMLEDVALKSADLIADVLDHAQSVAAAPDVSVFDFDMLCQATVAVLDPQGLHRIDWPRVLIRGDRTVLQIALRNLIDNAIKHGGRTHLAIRIALADAEDGMLEVTLSDNGKGLDNPGRAFLDTGHFRVDSGYGLLGIRRMITVRGGTIRVLDQTGQAGCTVRFTLPGRLCGALAGDGTRAQPAPRTGAPCHPPSP